MQAAGQAFVHQMLLEFSNRSQLVSTATGLPDAGPAWLWNEDVLTGSLQSGRWHKEAIRLAGRRAQ